MLKEVLLGMKKNRLCEILIKPIALFAFVIFPAYVLAHSCVCCFGGEGSSGKVSSVCCPPSACHAGENEIAECVNCFEYFTAEDGISDGTENHKQRGIFLSALIQCNSNFLEYSRFVKFNKYAESLSTNQTPLHIICSEVLLI